MLSGRVRVTNLSLHYRACVERAAIGSLPIVLVHGLGVASPSMVPVGEALAPHHPVYAPDLPGFGESGKPDRALTVDELADSLAGWMGAVRLERAAFLGNSFGCQVAVELAVRHPELVEWLVLQGPTMDPRARSMWHQVLRWLRNSSGEHPAQLPILVRSYAQCGIRRLLKTFRHALEDPIEEKLPRVRVPTLVVRGSRDPIVPQRWVEEVVRLLPMGRLAVIPGGPHTLVHNMPQDLARVVREYLDDVLAGRGGV